MRLRCAYMGKEWASQLPMHISYFAMDLIATVVGPARPGSTINPKGVFTVPEPTRGRAAPTTSFTG
jgi:hypothetical protein